jgi:hypothetical protein
MIIHSWYSNSRDRLCNPLCVKVPVSGAKLPMGIVKGAATCRDVKIVLSLKCFGNLFSSLRGETYASKDSSFCSNTNVIGRGI